MDDKNQTVNSVDNFMTKLSKKIEKPITGRCIKCGGRTKFAIRYDIDCSPIWSHKKCEDDIRTFLFMLSKNNDKLLAKRYSKNWYKPYKK